MADAALRPVTDRETFLAWEAEQEDRFEFLAGIVWAMAGGSVDHNLTSGNLYVAIRPFALKRGCKPFQHNMKLAPDGEADVVYPDIYVTCRSVHGLDQTAGGATLVVEVVSPSTRQHDFSWKWALYQRMPELRHYLIVQTDGMQVLHYWRTDAQAAEGDSWIVQVATGPDAVLELSALDMRLALADIYAGTDIPPEPPPPRRPR